MNNETPKNKKRKKNPQKREPSFCQFKEKKNYFPKKKRKNPNNSFKKERIEKA